MTKVYRALTIAKYFLSIPDEDAGDLMSNLKLQKLLYYAQGYWVGLNGEASPLFRDTLYAWKYGPVVDNVYYHYSEFGANALPRVSKPSIESEHIMFLNEIYRVYGRFSAWVLRDMTHKESPWFDNYKHGVQDIEILKTDLEKFFKSKIKLKKT